MALSVKNPETDAAVRRLARLKNKSLTDTIREAVEKEYRRMRPEAAPLSRLRALAERYRRKPRRLIKTADAAADGLAGDSGHGPLS